MKKNAIKCPDCGAEICCDIQVDENGFSFWMCSACGTVHEDSSWYKLIDTETASNILRVGGERGLYVCRTACEVIGIDNSDGYALCEEFPDMAECLEWLISDKEMGE